MLCQVVDDEQQHTLVAASTLMPEIRDQLNGTGGANKVLLCRQLFLSSCPASSLRATWKLAFSTGSSPEPSGAESMVDVQEAAMMVGKKIAELCLQKNIEKVCFDRGGNIYHGRVQVRQAHMACLHIV